MKIGFFTTLFPYKKPFNEKSPGVKNYIRGGVEEVAYHLSINLARNGHKVYIFTTSSDGKNYMEKYGNITLFRYGKRFKIFNTDVSFKLIKCPLKYDFDVMHLHLGSPPATLAALKYFKKKRKPFVVTHHLDPDWNQGNIIRRILVFIYGIYYVKRALIKSDVIIALSDYFLNTSRFLGRHRTKIKIIPNGINLEEYNVPYTKSEARKKLKLHSNEKIILFVGNLIERKGPQILLKAMSIVTKNIPNSRLIFVGSHSNYVKVLRRLAKNLGIEYHVQFSGFVSDRLKMVYYKSADIFVLPSFSESFGIVLLEASACGLPLIVSDLEAFKAIVEDGYNGLFTKTGDEKDLAEKIVYLLENEDKMSEMGKIAKEEVKDYSWKKIAKKTEEIYKNVSSEV